VFLKKGRSGDCRYAENPGEDSGTSEETIPEGESLWKKVIGKPYSGKLNVRFDDGELEIGHGCDTGTLTDERVRNGEHKLQPEAPTLALYSTFLPSP
jgi:hypothetical protein